MQKLGFGTYLLLIKTYPNLNPEEVINRIKDYVGQESYSWFPDASVLFSIFLHGHYDWAVIFFAKDLIKAKKAVSLLMMEHKDLIDEYLLEEVLFQIKAVGKTNPDIDEELERIF